MPGVIKTTVDLPEQLKVRIVRMAREQNRSQAAVIREAIEKYLGRVERSRR